MTNYRQNADPMLINALAAGKSVPAAAAEAGISRATAFRRLQDPEIPRQVDELRENLTEVALDKLCHAAEPACKRLNVLLDGAASENVQLSAARTILDHMFTIRNFHKLQDRIRELEAQLTQEPQGDRDRYWPDAVEKGPPCVVGLDIQHGYRHVANWMEYILYKGGLPDERVEELKQEIAELRESAQRFDEAIAS